MTVIMTDNDIATAIRAVRAEAEMEFIPEVMEDVLIGIEMVVHHLAGFVPIEKRWDFIRSCNIN